MIEISFVSELDKRLEERKRSRVEVLSAGRCETIEAYNKIVGEITGIMIALSEIKNICDELEDLENQREGSS